MCRGALINAFEQGCANGTLKHVQLMVRRFGLTHDDVRGNCDRAMRCATKAKRLKTALWLATTYNVNKITKKVKKYLQQVCSGKAVWRHEFRRETWLDLARVTNQHHPYPE